MKNCEYYEQQIDLLLDGALPPSEEADLRLHLLSCPACAKRAQEMREIKEALSDLDDDELPEELHAHIMSALPVKREHNRSYRWVKPLAAVAACALLALIVIRIPKQELSDCSCAAEEPQSAPLETSVPEADAELKKYDCPDERASTFAGEGNDDLSRNSTIPSVVPEAAMQEVAAVNIYAGDFNAIEPETDFADSIYFSQEDDGYVVILERDSEAENAFLAYLAEKGFVQTEDQTQLSGANSVRIQDSDAEHILYFLVQK